MKDELRNTAGGAVESLTEQFRASVVRLAAAADEQKAYLEELGTAPSADELGIEFGDALLVVRSSLPASVAEAASRLDEYLTGLSGEGNEELWTVLALAEAPEWRRVRDLSEDVLREMNVA